MDGDWAQITYKGQVEGEAEAAPVAGEDSLVEIGGKDTVEAFSSALRGAKAGQELKAEVIYPADYAEPKLAGKTVAYEVEVKAIKKRTLPELNDDFAKEIGAYESYADLEARVREHMADRKRRSVEGETKDRLFAALTERYPFPVPESLVQEQIDARLERGLRALAAQGMNPEQMRKLDFAPPAHRPARQRHRRGKDHCAAGPHCAGGKHHRQRRGTGQRTANGGPAVPRAAGYPEGAIDAGRRDG